MPTSYTVPAGFAEPTTVDSAADAAAHTRSLEDPAAFWGEVGRRVQWIRPYTQVKDTSFQLDDFRLRWYADGQLNVSVNCIDRHLARHRNTAAIIWEGDDPSHSRVITYGELYGLVNHCAAALRQLGVGKGDRVTIYLPMIPEAAVAMLACARIGAVHSVVFGGFSPEALASRVADCGSKLIITADEGLRGGRKIPLKANVDVALHDPATACVEKVLVVRHTGGHVHWDSRRDVHYEEALASAPLWCEPEVMDAEDPLFILYTSGSTGKPKGVLHTTGGYLVYADYTFATVFDHRDSDVFWCTADVGWVTGHSYVVYGPLSNGATTLMFEGIPTYPDFGRFWEVCDKHQVTVFYTAPTALRSLMREGDTWVTRHHRQSLRLLGSVGEPLNAEAWEWYHRVVGDHRCPIVDTWWQTETGGILISALPGASTLKPGSVSKPLPGILPALLSDNGTLLEGVAEGNLVILDSWPGQMRSMYGDHARFLNTYFTAFPGTYVTGDGARRDAEGDWWITGRVDDVINVSGHRMGTAEVESALDNHAAVAEVAVVGFPHAIKGQGIYAYVTLKADIIPSEDLRKELRALVRHSIGPIATPDVIQWAPGLPKTRSGKIMRRILRKIAANDVEHLGDISTLADPSVVQQLLEHRQ
jgi:acetyl-CoA synthetase